MVPDAACAVGIANARRMDIGKADMASVAPEAASMDRRDGRCDERDENWEEERGGKRGMEAVLITRVPSRCHRR